MASETPQFQESQPVLSPVTVHSRADSHEAFAKTLGSLATKAAEETESIVSEQSQAMYINSVANAEQLKTNAQIRMLQNPDQAQKISEQSAYTLNTIKDTAFVNKKDRAKLNAYITGTSDDIRLKATQTAVHQGQLMAAFTHFANWPDQLKAYQDALIHDHDKAETLKEAMVSSLKSLVATRAITPEQAGSSMKTMEQVVGSAQRIHEMYGNANTTAQDYHTAVSHPLNHGEDMTQAPINASTGWLIDYHNNDRTFQGVLADINQRKLPNPEAFTALPKAQQEHALMAMHGVMQADGMINSGASFPEIEHSYKSLSQKNQVLSYQDQAKRDALGNYINKLKNGNYLEVMVQTPAGSAIMNNFTQRDAAIQNLAVDPAKKAEMIIANKNNLVNESVAYAHGHHIPSEYVQPIPQADIAQVQGAFEMGQDPSTVMRVLGSYSKQNQVYVANAMKDPNQRMVVNAIALSGDNIKPQDKLDLIAANQKGRTYISNNKIEGATSDKSLMARIATNLAPAMRLVANNYDFEQAQTLQNAMLNTTLKFAKYKAQKDNNIGAKDEGFIGTAPFKTYVDEASKVYGSSYQPKSGTNWIVNPQQLPQALSDSELDVLADHVTNEGYKYLQHDRGVGEFESAVGRNPLRMIVSPTNDLQAVDGNGKVYYSMPFTANATPFAQESKKRREAERKQALLSAYEKGVTVQLNARERANVNPQ